MMRKIFLGGLVLLILLSSIVPTYAISIFPSIGTTAVYAASSITADDGKDITVPAGVVEAEYFVIWKHTGLVGAIQYVACVFDLEAQEGGTYSFRQYYSSGKYDEVEARNNYQWQYRDGEGIELDLCSDDSNEIVFSSYDYYHINGDMLHESNYQEDEPLVVPLITLTDPSKLDHLPYHLVYTYESTTGDLYYNFVFSDKPYVFDSDKVSGDLTGIPTLEEGTVYRSSASPVADGLNGSGLTNPSTLINSKYQYTSNGSSEAIILGKTIIASNHSIVDENGAIHFQANIITLLASDVEEEPENELIIEPVRSYHGYLPSVHALSNSGAMGASGDWLVYRDTQDVWLEFNDDGTPIDIENTKWSYWLLFFPNGYESLTWTKQERTAEDGSTHYVWPQLRIDASLIYRYRLGSESFESNYITDDVLNASAGLSEWQYQGITNDYITITSYDSIEWTRGAYEEMLSNTFIASSFNYNVAADTVAYITFENNSAIPTYNDYELSAFTFPAQIYDGFGDWEIDDPTTEDGTSDGSSVDKSWLGGWLDKIYQAIKDGFDAVLDKLDGGATSDKMENDITQSEDPEDGFSILDVFRGAFSGIIKVLGGIGGFFLDVLDTLVTAVTDFFDVLGSGVTDIFEGNGTADGENEFTTASSFFGQVLGLLPQPIINIGVFALSAFLLIAVIKLFMSA